jgi:pimeloyl-ACP methyl ester carboxylesterase
VRTEITVPFRSYVLKGDQLQSELSPTLLLLHGAGRSGRYKFDGLRCALHRHGFGSIGLDFIGHGETGGDLIGSSLASRTDQALAFCEAADLRDRVAVFGSSMGAYTAVRLTEFLPIDSLILNVPGMYHRTAYEIPFGPAFSEVLRTPFSWRESDAWDILRKFRGRVLLISAEFDEVIPIDVLKLIESSCCNASLFHHLVIRGEGHQYPIDRSDILCRLEASILPLLDNKPVCPAEEP